jgi:hypothetical protein
MRKSQEGNDDIRHRDVKKLPHLRKERKTMNGIKGWSAAQRPYLGSRETPSRNPYEIFGGKITKQIVGTSRRLRGIRKRTLWRDRPPPKRKKIVNGVRIGNVGTPATPGFMPPTVYKRD